MTEDNKEINIGESPIEIFRMLNIMVESDLRSTRSKVRGELLEYLANLFDEIAKYTNNNKQL